MQRSGAQISSQSAVELLTYTFEMNSDTDPTHMNSICAAESNKTVPLSLHSVLSMLQSVWGLLFTTQQSGREDHPTGLHPPATQSMRTDGGSHTAQTKQWDPLWGGQGDREQPLTSAGPPLSLSEYRLNTVTLHRFTIASKVHQLGEDGLM